MKTTQHMQKATKFTVKKDEFVEHSSTLSKQTAPPPHTDHRNPTTTFYYLLGWQGGCIAEERVERAKGKHCRQKR